MESHQLVCLIASASLSIHETFLLQSSCVTWSPLGPIFMLTFCSQSHWFPCLLALTFRNALWYFFTALISCPWITGSRGHRISKVGGKTSCWKTSVQQPPTPLQLSNTAMLNMKAFIYSFSFRCSILKKFPDAYLIWCQLINPKIDHSVRHFRISALDGSERFSTRITLKHIINLKMHLIWINLICSLMSVSLLSHILMIYLSESVFTKCIIYFLYCFN